MAINKKLVHFKTFAKFNEELSAGNILDTSICWIKDTKQIWTHGQFYDCSSLTDEDIVGTALVGYTESVETNENLDLTAEDTIVGAFGKLVKAIKDNEEVDSAAFVKLRDSVGLDENLGFSTSAGDSNVTEAIERIDGKIISTGDGTKFLADNGQYLTAGGSVDVTDILSRLIELATTGEGTCTEEDYNTLKKYADNGITTYVNQGGTATQTDITYTDSTILIRFSMFDGEAETVQLYKITSDKIVTNVYNSFLGASIAGDGLLGSYTKPSAYSAITKNNSISTAIGKLEANVEKITTSGDGSKFLSNDGTYKEVSDTIISIDSIDGYTGTLLGITHSEIVDCIRKNNNIKVKIESVNGINSSLIFTPISCTYIEESNAVMISIDVSLAYSNLYTAIALLMISNDNSCAIAFVNKAVICGDLSNNGDIAINLLYRGVEGQKETSTNILLKKTGDGTKFLSDDGQYKNIGTPIEAVGSSTGTITQELSPNKYYKFGRCTSLTIALGAEVAGILNEYMFEFTSGVTPTVLNLPETVKWNNGNVPTIEANKKYIVLIVSNIAVIGGA